MAMCFWLGCVWMTIVIIKGRIDSWLLSGGHAAGSVKRGGRFSRFAFSASTWFGLPIRQYCSVVSATRPRWPRMRLLG